MDDVLERAIALIRSGQKKQGGQLLAEIVKHQPRNESAWLWLANCVESNEQTIFCLTKALEINPQNDHARKTIQKLQQDQEHQVRFVDKPPVGNQVNIFSMISFAAGILGWVFGIFTMLVSFTPLSSFFPVGQSAFWPLVLPPGLGWLTAIVTGFIGIRQIKRRGSQQGGWLAKSGIIIGGIGCALFYGFLLAIAWGFYMLFSEGYLGGFIPPSVSVPF